MAQTSTVARGTTSKAPPSKSGVTEIRKPVKAPSFKITPLESHDQYIKLMVYGGYGVGKTRLCGTCVEVPSMHDVLLIDAEAGTMTLVDNSMPFDKIDIVQVKTYKQVAKVHQFLKAHCILRDQGTDEALEKMAEMESQLTGRDVTTPKQYRTAIIDSISEIEALCMGQILGVSENTALDEEGDPAEFKEYKINNSMMRRMVRDFRNLPMNLLITCAQSYTQNEVKKLIFQPALTGQLRGQVQGFMDVVGYLRSSDPNEAGEIKRALFVQPSGRWDAKCRFSAFKGVRFEDPTIKSILEAVGLVKPVNAKAKGGK